MPIPEKSYEKCKSEEALTEKQDSGVALPTMGAISEKSYEKRKSEEGRTEKQDSGVALGAIPEKSYEKRKSEEAHIEKQDSGVALLKMKSKLCKTTKDNSEGSQIGKIIKVQTKTLKEVVIEEEIKEENHQVENLLAYNDDSSSIRSEISVNAAFTSEALANASFLFSCRPKKPCQKLKTLSRVDKERLSLITMKNYKDPVVILEPPRHSSDSHSLEQDVIKQAVESSLVPSTEKKTDRQDLSSSKNTKEECLSVGTLNETADQKSKMEHFVSKESASVTTTADTPDNQAITVPLSKENFFSQEDCSNSKSVPTRSQSVDNESAKEQLVPRDSLAEILDGSPTSTHSKRYDAITPYKTLSPHERFKKALKRFEKSSHGDEENMKSNLEKNKSSKNSLERLEKISHCDEVEQKMNTNQEKNKSSERKNSFVFSRVTEWNGQLRRNMPRSLRNTRRMTTGEDVIAPRKPTLINPFFRKSESALDYYNHNGGSYDDGEADTSFEEKVKLEQEQDKEKEGSDEEEDKGRDSDNDQTISVTAKDATLRSSTITDLYNIYTPETTVEKNSISESPNSTEILPECNSQDLDLKNWPDDETDELDMLAMEPVDDELSHTEEQSLRSRSTLDKSSHASSIIETMYENISESQKSIDSSRSSSSSEEDVFANLIRTALSDDESESESEISSHRKSEVSKNLSSALKKRNSKNNENEVRWSAVEARMLHSPLHQDENDLEVLHEQVSPGTEELFPTPPPLSHSFTASVNPRAINKGSKKGFTVYSPVDDSTCSHSPKLANICNCPEDNKENTLVYCSPSNSTLCSYSPLPPMAQKNNDGPNQKLKSTPKSPSDLCLSPLQRTPMQARKWRTLAAKAQAKKDTTTSKKKRFGKKRTPLRVIQ